MRFLLDEHYPGWLADYLTEAGHHTQAVVCRDDLRGVDDTHVLVVGAREARAVVTEDVTTFSMAIAAVAHHRGVIFCHHARFPRTKAGLRVLADSLVTFASSPPGGIVGTPFVWWLSPGDANS